MSTMKFSDEELMSYADGELDGPQAQAIREAASGDPAIAARIEMFTASRKLLHYAFESAIEEPVPQRLRDAIEALGEDDEDIERPRVVPFPERRAPTPVRAWMPRALAASAALLVAVATGWWLRDAAPPGAGSNALLASVASLPAPVSDALEHLPSGEVRNVRFGGNQVEVLTLATYASGNTFCREFETTASADQTPQSIRGVACRQNNQWVARAVADQAPSAGADDSYRPASGSSDLMSVIGRSPALSASEEQDLLANGWRQR
jgi:hypothetical protein